MEGGGGGSEVADEEGAENPGIVAEEDADKAGRTPLESAKKSSDGGAEAEDGTVTAQAEFGAVEGIYTGSRREPADRRGESIVGGVAKEL